MIAKYSFGLHTQRTHRIIFHHQVIVVLFMSICVQCSDVMGAFRHQKPEQVQLILESMYNVGTIEIKRLEEHHQEC